jgi:hypothetical protein
VAAFPRHAAPGARSQAALAGGIAIGCAGLTLAGLKAVGELGLVAPLLVVCGLVLVNFPAVAAGLAVGLVVLCENKDFGLATWSSGVYSEFVKGVTPIDVLMMVAVAGVGLRLLRQRRRPRLLPASLGLPLTLLGFALLAGADVGHASGASAHALLFAIHSFAYVAIVPLLVVNLDFDARAVRGTLVAAVALAGLKALIGLAALVSGHGTPLGSDGTSLTYLEPTANWLALVVVLWVAAMFLRPPRPPAWLLAMAPLLVASLLLSYRRSFWIAFVVGVILVVALGLSHAGRRMAVPVIALMATTIVLVGSVVIPGDSPVARRAESLRPSSVNASATDRYRLDERANVWANVRAEPITGLGLTVPWVATARPLPLDLGRDYVHFAALYWWMKLGILGLLSYVATLAGGALLAWRVWRRSAEHHVRAFGLATMAGIAGLVPIEMTASFTGVDTRFTILFGAQLGLLAVLARRAAAADVP